MDALVKNFIGKRTLSTEIDLNTPIHEAIYRLEKSDEIVRELLTANEEKISNITYWPSLHDMYERSHEYCCGALGCFLIAELTSSEAICRTAIEGSVNLHYASLGDSLSKQISYFKDHLETERKQNINWERSVKNSDYPADAKEHHLQKIKQKNMSLDHYEHVLRESFALAGIDFNSATGKWPSIFDRFREINDEVGYRTVYTALCSQAHNDAEDAEDALNKFYARVAVNVDGLEDAQIIEQYNFSLYMVLMAIKYHILASGMYIAKLEISASPIIEQLKKIMKILSVVTEEGPKMVEQKITYK